MLEITGSTPTQRDIQRECGRTIGRGAYRDVYAFGDDKVIKYDRSYDGRSNMTECAIWNALKDTEVAPLLVPILEHSDDDRVIVQPRITTYSNADAALANAVYLTDDSEERQRLYEKRLELDNSVGVFRTAIYETTQEYGWSPGDLHDENIGVDAAGNVVCCDYGNFSPTEDNPLTLVKPWA